MVVCLAHIHRSHDLRKPRLVVWEVDVAAQIRRERPVVDADARDVVMNYFNRYYSSDYDDSHYFAKVFEDSAEEIMLQSDSGWRTTLLLLIAVIGVLVAMNIIDYKNTMKIKKQEAAAKILNAKVDDPGWKDDAEVLSEKYSDEASELASKYEDKN